MFMDAGDKGGPVTTEEKWTYASILVVIGGLFIAEIATNYEPAKLSALFIVLFWIPLLALHEFGHAIMSALCGWHVGQVVIGMGRVLKQFQIRSATIQIRLFPFEGFCASVPTSLKLIRIKSALIYFAGPGIELLFAGIVLWIVGPSAMFSAAGDNYWLLIWQSLALAATVQAVLNLIPHGVYVSGVQSPNDGLGIIYSFFWPIDHFSQMIGSTYNPEKDEWELKKGDGD